MGFSNVSEPFFPVSFLPKSSAVGDLISPFTVILQRNSSRSAVLNTDMNINDSLPKSIQCLKDYNRHKFFGDAVAGITVGLVAMPLAMAFAIASGVSPQAGLYTAIIAGFLISLLGGSSTQIGGPT